MAVHADSDERLMEMGLLGLTDGVVAAVVDQEDLDPHVVMDDRLKFLKVHLDASVTGHKDNILCMVRHPCTDRRREIVTHGSDRRVADKPLSFLHLIGMSAYHARGAVAHNRDHILLHAFADLLDRRVNICRLVISGLIVFRKNDRVFFFPFLTSSDPPVYGFFILCSAVRIELFLVEDELQLLEKVPDIRMDRHVNMDRRFL